MSETPASAAPPGPSPPATGTRAPRRMSRVRQFLLGFLTPVALTVAALFVANVSHSMRGSHPGSDMLTYWGARLLIVAVAAGMWWWSGRRGWRAMRAGILAFFALVAVLLAWALYGTWHAMTSH